MTEKLAPGPVRGAALDALFAACQRLRCALPAVNVVGSHGIVSALQAAREARAPIIIQFSHTGAQFVAGKFLDNSQHAASIAGAIAGAEFASALSLTYGVPVVLHTDHCAKKLLPWVEGLVAHGERYFAQHGQPLFSSHMLDLSEEPLADNLATCQRLMRRLGPLGMTLEMELGVTGGEEDGVDHSGVDSARLYTRPDEVLQTYDALAPLGSFTVAAAFGNTHGVYKPGNVKLRPEILRDSQAMVQAERRTGVHPLRFVFHGGSGSTREEIQAAVDYGVVKMNIDTDAQWAFCQPIQRYMEDKSPYLHSQIGNPEGADRPNKKYIDPRSWLHLGEQGMAARLVEAFRSLNSYGKFDF